MHRDFSISVDASATDDLTEQLLAIDGVISLSVQRGNSVKPPGDVLNATVLNSAADQVLQLLEDAESHGSVSITTSSVDSLIDGEHQGEIRSDRDEAAWEEAETAMRRHTRVNFNFLMTNAGGGVVAACGLASGTRVGEATALVAAAMMAPAFEPLARIGLGAINRHGRLAVTGGVSALVAYVTLIASSLLTILVLRAAGHEYAVHFMHTITVHDVEHPPTVNLLLSAAGAITGVVMVSAGRFTQLMGPLVALQLLPAAATIGGALEMGHGTLAAHALLRLVIDIAMVLVAALLVFAYKQATVHGHRRTPH